MLLHAAKSANVNSSQRHRFSPALLEITLDDLPRVIVTSGTDGRRPSKGREDAPVKLAAWYATPLQFCIGKPV